MTCQLKEELLALHAGGDLPVAEAAEVEQHVLQCRPCASELAAYRSARQALLDARHAEPASPGLWEDLDARLDVVDATTRHRRPWFQRYGLPTSLAAAAALLLAVQFLPTGSGATDATTPGLGGDTSLAQDASGDSSTDPGLRPASNEELLELLQYGAPAQIDPADQEGLVSRPVASQRNF